jgi:TolA-binding protein
MKASKYLISFFWLGISSLLVFVCFANPSNTPIDAHFSSTQNEFSATSSNDLEFIEDTQNQDLFSYFEEISEFEIEVEDTFNHFSQKQSFGNIQLVTIFFQNQLFSKAKFLSLHQPPFYQLYCNWKSYLFT